MGLYTFLYENLLYRLYFIRIQPARIVTARLSRYTAHTAYTAIQPYTPYIYSAIQPPSGGPTAPLLKKPAVVLRGGCRCASFITNLSSQRKKNLVPRVCAYPLAVQL